MAFGIDASYSVVAAIPALRTTNVPPWLAVLAAEVAAPVSFVCRYLDGNGGKLEPPEVLALSKAGLPIVSIWEKGSPSSPWYFTHTTKGVPCAPEDKGYADGAAAWAWAAKIAQPSGTPVYFAVEMFNPAGSHDTLLRGYFNGIRASLDDYNASIDGRAPDDPDEYGIGVYGPSDILTFCSGESLAEWFWQSGSTGSSPWKLSDLNLLQIMAPNHKEYWAIGPQHPIKDADGNIIGESFCGIGVDFNLAFDPDNVGGWCLDGVVPDDLGGGGGGGGGGTSGLRDDELAPHGRDDASAGDGRTDSSDDQETREAEAAEAGESEEEESEEENEGVESEFEEEVESAEEGESEEEGEPEGGEVGDPRDDGGGEGR